MKTYSRSITKQGQTKPIIDRDDMVKNNAGGYGFKVDAQALLERFLLIGSEGGTYYVKEQELTEENAKSIIELIKLKGNLVLTTLLRFAKERSAPKPDAGIFVLALICTYGSQEVKNAAYKAIPTVCNTATHLFQFVANVKDLRGWSRGLRRGVANWYLEKPAVKLAYQLVKYRSRVGFTHKDVLRLSHPRTNNPELNELFQYAIGKTKESGISIINAYEKAQAAESPDTLAALIEESNLSWEMIPTEHLNDKKVLSALVENMPISALLRSLNRFSSADLTHGNTAVTKKIVSLLTDEILIAGARVHPLNVVNSMATYASGRGVLGGKTWDVNQNIVDALHKTFDLAVKSIESTGKNILVGVDVSGSMNTSVGGMQLQASQIGNLLAYTLLRSEPNAEVVLFDTELRPLPYGRRHSLDQVLKMSFGGGGTDCAQPILHALRTKNKYDAIVILTDSETWAGTIHGAEALVEYRRKVNPNVKVIEVAMTATPSTTFPSNDKNLLRVVGFDASVIDVINSYLKS